MKQGIRSLWMSLWFCMVLYSCSDRDKPALLRDPHNVNAVYDLALESKLNQFQSISEGYTPANEPPSIQNKAMEHLGHALFYEKMLYGNKSCNSCHNVSTFGTVVQSTTDHHLQQGRNIPSILNAALDSIQFWHGNMGLAQHLQQQGFDRNAMSRFMKDSAYRSMFKRAFPAQLSPITYTNLVEAITAFERKLKTPAAFDRYLDGDHSALTLQQKKGLLSFINIGCIDCHVGASIGGDLTKKFGVFKEYWIYTKSSPVDEGKYTESRDPKDKYVFSVPSLRNVEKTAPYFHDGSVHKLEEVVKIMAEVQLDYTISVEEQDNIVAFLKSLTSDSLNARYKSAPVLN